MDILLAIWPVIKRQFPRATLDIYYGWQHWGLLSPEKEAEMKAQIAHLAPLGVSDHGCVGDEELNRAYERASFWTYPCTDEETFCITALRAQLAGAVPIILVGSALRETVRHGYRCSTRREYFKTLIKALQQAEDISLEARKEMGQFVLQQFTWEAVATQWEHLFEAS